MMNEKKMKAEKDILEVKLLEIDRNIDVGSVSQNIMVERKNVIG